MPKLPTNRVYYASPAEAYDNFKVQIDVQDSYEAVVPKFFSLTNTPPIFEDPFSNNMARAYVPLKILVDIHTGGYIYSLKNPETDIPEIVRYLTWFIDSYNQFKLDKEQNIGMNKIVTVRDFYKRWYDKVMEAREKEANGGKPKVRSFAEGGYAK